MTAPDIRAAFDALVSSVAILDEDGDVIGLDADRLAQAREIAASMRWPCTPPRLDNRKGADAWFYQPRHHLQWSQPDDWQACLQLWGCDCAERALIAERQAGREPHPDLWAGIETRRRYIKGEATDDEMKAARDAARAAAWAAWAAARDAARAAAWAARDAARDAAGAAAWAAAWAAARAAAGAAAGAAAWAAAQSAQSRRLWQYAEHGLDAEGMPWPEEVIRHA